MCIQTSIEEIAYLKELVKDLTGGCELAMAVLKVINKTLPQNLPSIDRTNEVLTKIIKKSKKGYK